MRLFAQTQSMDQAKAIFLDSIAPIQGNIQGYSVKRIESYWKIKELTVIEVEIDLVHEIKTDEQKTFLASISDKWTFLGNPADEAVASRKNEDCHFLKNGVEMINIFF
ncbi:MAG: hypothetical protein AB9836_02705 [Aminipila sp.]